MSKYISIWKEINGDDSTDKIKECVKDCINSFGELNIKDGKRILPRKLIVYRDGLSDSQQRLALNFEIPAINAALEDYPGVGFAYIIANKKVSCRFFPKDRDGKIKGPEPGMIIDKDITSKSTHKNFYMVSQLSRQGAAAPSHYHILYMNEKMNSEEEKIIKLTYKLCYLYFHINAGIKIPAPIQYAERCGALLGDKVNSDRSWDFVLPGRRFVRNTGLFYI